ncbi:MAG: TetR/AcrR family transcriptional regulator [Gemmatimonadota bacterium]|nr:TetR/AcrR family transcriptional regulator [Gemmatimonadota bacterium]
MAQTTESRRDRLLAAARREFAEFGYSGARVARIAERATVNKQLLYYYFGSKAGLHAAVARTSSVPNNPPTLSTAPPERLRRAIEAVCTELLRDPALATSLTERQLTAEARAVVVQRVAAWLEAFATVVSDGQGQGYFRDDVDPASLARQVLVLCAGYHGLAPTLAIGADAPDRWPADVASLLLRALTW